MQIAKLNKKIMFFVMLFSLVILIILRSNNSKTDISLKKNMGNKDSVKLKSLNIYQETLKKNVNPLEGVWYLFKRGSGMNPNDEKFNPLTSLIIKNNRITKIINKRIIFEDSLVFKIDTIAKTKKEIFTKEMYFLPKREYEIYYNNHISLFHGPRMAEGVMVELYKKKSEAP